MLLTILVTIDIALSTATLMTFLENRKREVLKPKVEELEEAIRAVMKKVEEEEADAFYKAWHKEG